MTNSEGNTVKVTTSPAHERDQDRENESHGIHPGETVTVTGATGSNGAVSAESISVGSGGGGSRGAARRLGHRGKRHRQQRQKQQPLPVRQRRLSRGLAAT